MLWTLLNTHLLVDIYILFLLDIHLRMELPGHGMYSGSVDAAKSFPRGRARLHSSQQCPRPGSHSTGLAGLSCISVQHRANCATRF